MKFRALILTLIVSSAAFAQSSIPDFYFHQINLQTNYSTPLDGTPGMGLGLHIQRYLWYDLDNVLYVDMGIDATRVNNLDSAVVVRNHLYTQTLEDASMYWGTVGLSIGYKRRIYGNLGLDVNFGGRIGTGFFHGDDVATGETVNWAVKQSENTLDGYFGLTYTFSVGNQRIPVGMGYFLTQHSVGAISVDEYRKYYPYQGPMSSIRLSVGILFCEPPVSDEERLELGFRGMF